MSKKIVTFLLCMAVVCFAGALAACSDKTALHEHTWDSGEITAPATCGAKGVITYTCTGCGEIKTEPIAKTEHPHSEGWLYNDDEHWQEVTCEHTGERANVGAHEWKDGEVVKVATCQTAGVIKYTCVCGKTKTEILPKTGHSFAAEWNSDDENHWHACTTEGCSEITDFHAHNWDSGEITAPATCISEGVITYTCTACGKTKTEILPKTGHSFAAEWSSDDENHWRVCTTEGCSEITDLHAYNWDSGEVTTPATCISEGVITYTCTGCGNTKTEALPKTEHSFGDWTEEGQLVKYCTVCGYEEVAPSLAVDAGDTNVSVGGGAVAGITLFTRSNGYYTVVCETTVEVTFTCSYYEWDFNEKQQVRYEKLFTITPSDNAFTLKLPERVAAYVLAVSESETPVNITLQVEFSASASGHTHTFSDEWSYDGAYHWRACTGEDCDEETGTGLHTCDSEGVCTVCGYNGNQS